ncbi:MAG: penicillin-binding protein 1A [Hyphomicrobiales bacterium]
MGLFGGSRRRRRGSAREERDEPRLSGPSGRRRKAPPPEREEAAPKRKRRRSFVFTVLSWMMTLTLWGSIIAGASIAYVFVNLDKQGLFKVPEREPGMMLLAADGRVLAERGAFFGDEVRLDELPDYVPNALIAVEDRRFRQHFGIDLVGIGRAMVTNVLHGRVVEGGSTITQQLAKNLFLTPERSLERKFQEAVLALWLESKYTKDEILQLYLNRVYYGSGAVGVEKAAQRYFGKSARDVSIAEAAILAAVLKGPSAYNPITHPDKAAQRARDVIADMVDAGFITQDQANEALNAKTTVRTTIDQPATQYIVDWVSDQLPALIGADPPKESIVIETTIDRTIQASAEKSIRTRLAKEGAKYKVTQAAAVVMDPAGGVVAMVGGRSYVKSQFNRAVKALRQPGSAFKAFVYLTAVEQGATPDTVEVDEPVTFGDWTPENYKRKYLGPVTLTQALAMSLNTVAAKVAMKAGTANVIATAHRLGITSPLQDNASIALGTSEVTLLELTGAYGAFANGGSLIKPYVVTRISTRSGKVLYERQPEAPVQVVQPGDLYAMNYMLRQVVQVGTGTKAKIDGQDIAGKTGTSQDYRDAWFVGYSTYLVAGVWAGNDDNSPSAKMTGGTIPAEVFADIMVPAHDGLPLAELPGAPAGASAAPEGSMADGQPYDPYQQAPPPPPGGGGGFFDALRGLFGGGVQQPRQPVAVEPRAVQPPQATGSGGQAKPRDAK